MRFYKKYYIVVASDTNEVFMSTEENYVLMRFRVRTHVYKKYKVLCAMNDISIPKQTEDIIRTFIKSNERIEIPYEVIEKIKDQM
jgi:hypothetical protein